MYLFFDTETTGLPKSWKAPVTKLENWPRMVQIAWMQYDDSGKLILERSYIIKPQGFTIPSVAVKIHGISTQRANKEGIPLNTALNEFSALVDKSEFLVAHNIKFDEKIVGAEYLREKISTSFFKKKTICTMALSTDFCKIPGQYGYKWPTLSELHIKLFNTDFDEAHDAGIDVTACARCFFELKKLGIIK